MHPVFLDAKIMKYILLFTKKINKLLSTLLMLALIKTSSLSLKLIGRVLDFKLKVLSLNPGGGKIFI